MFPGLTELHLTGCLIELIWIPKSKSYIDTKNQLADILTKGNFTRDEWSRLLCFFNISHFSSTVCSVAMAKRSWDHIAYKMLLEFAESGCPIFRAATPLSRGQLKSKGHGKLSIHFAATQEKIETIFRKIVSANQLSHYGAVANMCEEYESLHDRSGQPDVVMGQSIVLSEAMAEVPLENDDPAHQNFLLQRFEERIKSFTDLQK